MAEPIQSSDWELEVACNLCGGREHEALRVDQQWNCTFVRCIACGLMFYQPRLKESYVVRNYLWSGNARDEAESLFHQGVLFGEPQGSAEEQKETLQSYYRFMLNLHTNWYRKLNGGRPPDSIFEAGCSVGWYLKVARDEFLDGSKLAQGCDANRFSAAKARSGFGLDVFAGTFQTYPLQEWQKNRYHLIAALDYIEHTYTPREDLVKLFEMAAPGAVLLLKTFLHELDAAGNYIHPVFHVHHFTGDTLRGAIESAGWKIVEFDDQRERPLAQVTVLACKPSCVSKQKHSQWNVSGSPM